jgi:hypothetical protein
MRLEYNHIFFHWFCYLFSLNRSRCGKIASYETSGIIITLSLVFVFFSVSSQILPYYNTENIPMKPGMSFTIEPILTEGKNEIGVWPDNWTAATIDGSWLAHFCFLIHCNFIL